MNVFSYANPSDFEPQTEEGDFGDTTENEVEVLDIDYTEAVRMPTTPECLCCKEFILEYR